MSLHPSSLPAAPASHHAPVPEILSLSALTADDAAAASSPASPSSSAPPARARSHLESHLASFAAADSDLTPLAMPSSPSLLAMNLLAAGGLADNAAAVQQYFTHESDAALVASVSNFSREFGELHKGDTDDLDAKLDASGALHHHHHHHRLRHHLHRPHNDDDSSSQRAESKKRKAAGGVLGVDLQTKIRLIELAEEYQYDPKASGRSKQEPGAPVCKEQISGIRLAAQFGLNKSTVSRILKRKDEFKKAYYKDNISGGSKHINKKSKFEKLNQLVENWFDMTREKKVAVSDTLIRDVGKRFAEELGIEDFRGSNGWVRSLRNRKESQARHLSAEAMDREKLKRDAEAIERMRLVFPNGLKDMAGFFRDLSTFLEKDCGGVGAAAVAHAHSVGGSTSSGRNPSGLGGDSDGASAAYPDLDEEALKEEERAAEGAQRKKMVEMLRAWSHELTESELSRLKKRLKPRQVANLPEPLEHAESVGPALPAFNFVERRAPKALRRAEAQQSPGLPRLRAATGHGAAVASAETGARDPTDCEEILFHVIAKWAAQVDEPTLSHESKATRVWQSMLRHSDMGRFGGSESSPNRVCTALCLEVVRQILVACGASALLCEVLLGGLANSIFRSYDPSLPYSAQQQYADVVAEQQAELDERQQQLSDIREQQEGSVVEAGEHLAATALALKTMDGTLRTSAITGLVSPYLNDDLFLVLWNAMATTCAFEKVDAADAPPRSETETLEEEGGEEQLELAASRKRASALANVVLQERVRLMFTVWLALSAEEQSLLLATFQTAGARAESGATKLTAVLRALEETRKSRRTTPEVDCYGGANALVQTIIQQQKLNPSLLVSAINQSPEVLLSAVAQNLGILRFTITKFAGPVKRFLKLDPKACDHLDSLVLKNRGVQLLWGTNSSAVDTALGLGNVGGDDYFATPAGGDSLAAGGGSYLVDWFTSHIADLAALFLRQPELLKELFADMHQRADVGAFYRLMLQLQSTRGVQNFMRRASVATLERVAQEDPGEILRLLREVFHDDAQSGPNRDLLDQLRSSQYLVTCLSEFHPSALQDILSSHIDTWKHYFVDAAASNDGILRESLLLRAENVEGGDALVRIFDAVADGSTAALNLQAIDFSASPSDLARARERESSTRRKMQQCLYLRGIPTVFRALIVPQIATAGFHSRSLMAAAGFDAGGTRGGGAGASGSDSAGTVAATSATQFFTQLGVDLPSVWQTYLRAFFRQQCDKEPVLLKLTKANVKTLILDICLEFLKADHLQLDNQSLWTIAPFVCDYFIVRYESPALVGCWLFSFVEGLLAFPNDPRVAFFCSASGLSPASGATPSPGYDVFLYYLHALGHVFFGQMKIFKSENRLEETPEGACPVPVRHIAATADVLFGLTLTNSEKRLLHQEINALPTSALVKRPPAALETAPSAASEAATSEATEATKIAPDGEKMVELDDAMELFLLRWNAMNEQVDTRYKQAFELHDTGSSRIGLEQFIKIVTSVTNGRVSARECRLVFGNVGHEFLDLDTLLRVTRAYQLRLFNAHLSEVPFQEQELQELRLSVGRTNISSVERFEASHQNKATKTLLRKQSALVERLLGDIQQHAGPQSGVVPKGDLQELLCRAWHEIRACAKMLHTAKLTQHYLSRLFLQFSLLKWVRQARKRTQEEERRRTLEQLSA
ncbi:hypothetical protein PybrP1_009830 [[Pythium] brassicae (nom. inval.)]|nr:hypothetical protein PybrP1_009830 [[Pythium] brassicae (nom. inval.)]